MQSHRLRRYASFALAAFMATVCVTLWAPVVDKTGLQLVCSVSGSKFIPTGDAGVSGASPLSDTHTGGVASCPLCLPVSPPPSFVARLSAPLRPLEGVEQSLATVGFADVAGAPLPARGPPFLS